MAGARHADAAGAWLQGEGLRPTHLVRTRTQRVEETVGRVLGVLGLAAADLPTWVRGIPVTVENWNAFAEACAREWGDEAVVLVGGHHTTQNLVRDHLGGPPTLARKRYAAVVVLEHREDGWRCTACWPGSSV